MKTTLFIAFLILIYSHAFAQESGDSVLTTSKSPFKKVEMDSHFLGGTPAWNKFLESNVNPNIPVDNGAPQGVYLVIIQITIDKDGALSEFKPFSNHGFGMEQELIRVLKLSPNWRPAIQNGKNVNSYKKIQMSFVVSSENDKKSKKKKKLKRSSESQ